MFDGSMVALITPMNEVGEIDFEALEQLLEFHVANETDAIVAVGTTGESGMLTRKEHKAVIQFIVDKIRDRMPVIAGTGAVATHDAIELTREAMDLGVQACLILTPAYVKPTQEGLYRHYRAIAEAVAIPQIIYNVPGRTACDILPTTIARLSDIPNIIGVKEATGDSKRTKDIMALCGERLDIYSGEDAATIEIMREGGKGVISVTANVAPKAMHELCANILKDELYLARAINEKLNPLHVSLFLESNPIPVKWALYEMGMISPGIRLPLTPLSIIHHETVRQALQAAEIL